MQPVEYSFPTRSTEPRSSLGFPILVFDEQKLTPSLGYLFKKRWIEPLESLISILWKFERANSTPGHVIARLIRPDIDPYEGVVPQVGDLDLERLVRTLAIPRKLLRTALLKPSQHPRYHTSLRFCKRCMSVGFHSVLHQMLHIENCPIHRRPLETRCDRCDYEAPYVANVRLLESPFRCSSCGNYYGSQGWSPNRPPMKFEHRKILTRMSFERYMD